ncbi:MAG TPA: glycosyltransferase family 4 protein, partial [Patescibacteria group bacterium]|nr:glycosyltransferase family 4 protein [Patescibacteria group bacterium]
MDPSIAYLSTYPPRRCGIASFTQDLRAAVGLGGAVFALGPTDDDQLTRPPVDPPEVRAVLSGHTPADYRRASAAIEGSGAEVVSLQHEYGIYGGPDGSHVLELTSRLDLPVVATFHTVLSRPTDRQREVLQEIARSSEASVVMSESAARRLVETYDVDPSRLHVIPHGVPDLSPVDPAIRKPEFQLDGRPTILSFGLVGPGKGYEIAIEAMATVREAIPNALYVILGATHPDLLRREGERYRTELRSRVRGLGLEDSVRFVDRFVGRVELGRWLQACDVFVTPYPNLDQIVSGTLSYAVGAGRPAVSTPYAYARELLAGGRGVLVPPAAPEALGTALAELLAEPERRAAISRRAYAYGRGMIWRTVGAAYADVFRAVGR